MPRSTLLRRLSAAALALTLSACDSDSGAATASAREAPPAPILKTPPPVQPEPAPPPPDAPPSKVQLAAVVAREIAAAPELADEILGKHGLDRDKFDAMIFEIAGDPALTQAYMAARRNR